MRKTFVLFFATAALLAGAIAPGASVVTAAQKKASRAPVKKAPAQPLTIYGRGYQKGYADGFVQGQADWSKGVPQDFKRADSYQRRDQSFAPQFATSEEYRQGFDLGFELGYLDAYYGRARNNAVPGNAAVLAKAAALADAQRARAATATAAAAAGERRIARSARRLAGQA